MTIISNRRGVMGAGLAGLAWPAIAVEAGQADMLVVNARIHTVDAANPRVAQQRFDLYLYSETSGDLQLPGFGASVETALQAELAQGALDLPPCTTLEEWHAFRAGLNQLMYTRYGVTVDDCVRACRHIN